MSAATLQNYQLQLNMMGHQDTPRDPDKRNSGRYVAIPFQSFLGHTTPDNQKPLHFQMNQPIEVWYPKSG